MMNPQDNQKVTFRDGDVVGRAAREEGRVRLNVLGKLEAVWSNGSAWTLDAYKPGELHLLRRPVRAGDRLICPAVLDGRPFSAGSLRNECPMCKHADGTPIEPPQKPAATGIAAEASPNLVAALERGMQETARMLGAQVYANQNQQALLAQQGYTGLQIEGQSGVINVRAYPPSRDEVERELRSHLETERARANRLADELQPLRDERDRLQRRCDALELQMRRAGIVPKDGAK